MMGSLAENDRVAFSKALVKRFHKRVLEITGDFMTTEEETLCHNYLAASQIQAVEEIQIYQSEIKGHKRVSKSKGVKP